MSKYVSTTTIVCLTKINVMYRPEIRRPKNNINNECAENIGDTRTKKSQA